MFCNISNQPPEEPVVTRKGGYLFEKSVITQYIQQNGKCPVTGEALTLDDIIEVKGVKSAKPRPSSVTSIPTLIQLLQNEWDALMLEGFTMKQHMDSVRQELAHSLYQHDSACRVIARLVRERDEARSKMESLQQRVEQEVKESEEQGAVESPLLPDKCVKRIQECQAALSSQRKERRKKEKDNQIPSASVDEVRAFSEVDSYNVHSVTKPGVLSIAIHKDDQLVATGGLDSVVCVYDRSAKKLVAKLEGHQDKVQKVLFHQTSKLLLSSGDDCSVRLWKYEPEKVLLKTLREPHRGNVRGLALHPLGDYFVSVGLDSVLAFWDLETGSVLAKLHGDAPDKPLKGGFTSVQFHPDGHLAGVGTGENGLCMLDLRSFEAAVSFPHQKDVNALSFSENGVTLASACADGTIKLWDLRSLNNFKNIEFEEHAQNPMPVTSVKFDSSGSFFAASCGEAVKVYSARQNNINYITAYGSSKVLFDVEWGREARWLAFGGLDKSVKLYGSSE